jgi:hypothetical protein
MSLRGARPGLSGDRRGNLVAMLTAVFVRPV